MDDYFDHLTEKIQETILSFSACQACYHCVIPPRYSYTVISDSNGIQGVCLRGTRNENSSTCTCGLQGEQQKNIETSIEAMWPIFNLRQASKLYLLAQERNVKETWREPTENVIACLGVVHMAI